VQVVQVVYFITNEIWWWPFRLGQTIPVNYANNFNSGKYLIRSAGARTEQRIGYVLFVSSAGDSPSCDCGFSMI
jgi:hypothetical protein